MGDGWWVMSYRQNGLGKQSPPEAVTHYSPPTTHHEQLSGPLGNGFVQFFVVPFSVITTCAVAEPS